MSCVELATEIRRVGRDAHRLRGKNRGYGFSTSLCVSRELVDRVPNDGCNGKAALLSLGDYLLISSLVKENLHSPL